MGSVGGRGVALGGMGVGGWEEGMVVGLGVGGCRGGLGVRVDVRGRGMYVERVVRGREGKGDIEGFIMETIGG